MTEIELRIRIAQSLADVPADAWNACARGPGILALKAKDEVQLTSEDNSSPDLCTQGQVPNPFVSHEFLSSLELSGSVGGRTGWLPRHVLVDDKGGTLLGAMPCYAKTHSRGEYVFDH